MPCARPTAAVKAAAGLTLTALTALTALNACSTGTGAGTPASDQEAPTIVPTTPATTAAPTTSTTTVADLDWATLYADLLGRRSEAIAQGDLTALAQVSSDPYLAAVVAAGQDDPDQLEEHLDTSRDEQAQLFHVVTDDLVMLAVTRTAFDGTGFIADNDGTITDTEPTDPTGPGEVQVSLVPMERAGDGLWRIAGDGNRLPAAFPGSIDGFAEVQRVPFGDADIRLLAAEVDRWACFLILYPGRPLLDRCSDQDKFESLGAEGRYDLMHGEPFETVLVWSNTPMLWATVESEDEQAVNRPFSASYYRLFVAPPDTIHSLRFRLDDPLNQIPGHVDQTFPLDEDRQSIRDQRNGVLEPT